MSKSISVIFSVCFFGWLGSYFGKYGMGIGAFIGLVGGLSSDKEKIEIKIEEKKVKPTTASVVVLLIARSAIRVRLGEPYLIKSHSLIRMVFFMSEGKCLGLSKISGNGGLLTLRVAM